MQEIFLAVVRGLPSFSLSGRREAFHTWLRTIIIITDVISGGRGRIGS
jgi:DNA-directed RNA polymerase specialized sigma24 family protein